MSEVLLKTGRLQGINFFKKVATGSELKLIKKIVEAKKYVGLPYIDESGKAETVSDLETFCQSFLGCTARVGESGSGKSTLRRDLIERCLKEGLAITFIQPRCLDKTNKIDRYLPAQERQSINL